MKKAEFKQASAVYWPFADENERLRTQKEEAVSQFGFYTALDLSGCGEDAPVFAEAVLRLTARNVFRVYINGELLMHGPARTAHGYARVDEADISDCLIPGINHIAVEVMTYGDTYAGYSNDMSISDGSGFLICELESAGQVLTATGDGSWGVFASLSAKHRLHFASSVRSTTSLIFRPRLWSAAEGFFAQSRLKSSRNCVIIILTNQNLRRTE